MQLTIEQAVQQGVASHKEGNLQEAERLYRAILQSQPGHPDANHNLGLIAVSQNKVGDALPFFKAALEANPNIEQFWLSYVDALVKANQLREAKQTAKNARKKGFDVKKLKALLSQSRVQTSSKEPSQEQLRLLLEHYQNGRLAAAEKLTLSITQDFPEHQLAWKVLGAVLKQTGRASESLVASQKSVQIAPEDPEAHNNLGSTFRELGRLTEAEASYGKALVLNPDYAEAHNNLGTTLKELERLDEAVKCYRQSIALNPGYAEAHNNLGTTLQELERLDEAEASFNQAINFNPDLAEAHYNLGTTLQKLGKLKAAEASLKRAIALKPGFSEAYSNLGVTAQQLGNLEEAKDNYTQAIALRPDYAEAYSNLGITFQNLARLDEAETSFKKAIALRPDFPEAHSNLGSTLRDLGQLNEAEKSYKQAIALRPDFPEAHSNLGATLQELGRLEEAETSLSKAIEIDPDYAEAHNNLCNILKELDRVEEVESVCNQVLSKKSKAINIEKRVPITCLLNHGRSGTMFLHSLFDGHPNLASLPGVYFKGWFSLDSWHRFSPFLTKPNWRENLVNALLTEYEPLFNANSKKNVLGAPFGQSAWLAKDSGFTTMGPERNNVFVLDEEAFSATLISLLGPLQSIDCTSFFELVHRAFEIAIRGKSDLRVKPLEHIFYHIHNPKSLEKTNFFRLYPDARVIRLTRNPIQSLESWIITGLDYARDTDNILSAWPNLVTQIVDMFVSIRIEYTNNRYHRGIKLEDIKHRPSSVIPQLALWMGIEDHPSLYESNFCGIDYWGPSATKTTGHIIGFDTRAIDQPIGRFFGKRDVVIFETLFWPFLSLYCYTKLARSEFRKNLLRIRKWLDEPLEFETKLYDALPEKNCEIQAVGSYQRLHRFLKQLWCKLDRDGTYTAMIQPLKID